MKYQKTLITGGKGLVGSAIESDYKPSRSELNLLDYNQTVDYLNDNKIDSIIHCAAKVGGIKANWEYAADFFDENILMNTNLLRAAHNCGVEKVVSFMSTCIFPDDAHYPLTPCQIHDGEPHPSNFAYAYAKRMIEVQTRAYRQQHNRKYVSVIPCNIYGPNDNFDLENSHVIPALIRKCHTAMSLGTDFEVWGDGTPLREFIYSGDVAKIAMWALEYFDSYDPLLVSTDEEISINDVATTIADEFGFTGNINFSGHLGGQHRKPSDNRDLKYLMNGLGGVEFTSFKDGIRKTIEWYSDAEDIRL